jgi:hypothetical protein
MAKHFKLVGTHAVSVLARLAARNIIKEQLRDQGRRLSLVPIREINEQALAYLEQHPELYQQALERAKQLGYVQTLPIMVTPDPTSADLSPKQMTQSRALILLEFLIQLLRFSVARAY